MSGAYYNEFDPFAAAWLRALIAAGHIAPGEVDERSIVDVRPDDLRGFTQCHFFAGIGVWSYALRRAGWSDDRPVWTGSCPCQPFSAAGAGEGFDDSRHLWPAWYGLVSELGPVALFGEQVASKDGLAWLDIVHSDLEAAAYTVGAIDTCAAGFGAPHIRQRFFFVAVGAAGVGQADSGSQRVRGLGSGHVGGSAGSGQGEGDQRQRLRAHAGDGLDFGGGMRADAVGDALEPGLEGFAGDVGGGHEPGRVGALASGSAAAAGSARGVALGDTTSRGLGVDGGASGLAGHADESGPAVGVGLAYAEHPERRSLDVDREDGRDGQDGRREKAHGLPGARCSVRRTEQPSGDGVVDTAGVGREVALFDSSSSNASAGVGQADVRGGRGPAGPVNGFWADAEWLPCRDGKARPVEPGTFPLAHGAPARVGRLRGYGNAINAEVATEFIRAAAEIIDERGR